MLTFGYRQDDEEDFGDEDNGWKIIHADVFRFPKLKSLFCSVIGVGTQLLSIGAGLNSLMLIADSTTKVELNLPGLKVIWNTVLVPVSCI